MPIDHTRYAHPSPWTMPLPPMTLVEMFDQSCDRFAERRLSDFMGARISFHEYHARATQFAAAMQVAGVAKGDRIGLYLPNTPDYIIAYYGALKAGAIVVNLSPLYSKDELAEQLRDSGARVVVTTDVPALVDTSQALIGEGLIDMLVVGAVAEWLPPVKRRLYETFKKKDIAVVTDTPQVVRMRTILNRNDVLRPVDVSPEDTALLQYTGGTTGLPKGAILTHQNLTANARQVNAIDPQRDSPDRIVGVLPFFHVFANTAVLNRTVLNGGMIAMLPRFDAGQALATLDRVRASALPGVPTMFQAMLAHPKVEKTSFASLRTCISGGAPMPDQVAARFAEVTGAQIVEGYGLTESSGVVSCNPYASPRPGTIGQPLPGTEVKLLDRDDPTRDAPAGEPGELVVRGPQVMQGYWNRPDAAPHTFAEGGWLRTGDVATIDADGYLTIVDRLKDMIAVGGFKVFPSVVEAQLYAEDAVADALVVGAPDDYLGERPRAYVTARPGAVIDADAMLAAVNARLGKHERLERIVVRDSLPKTMIGKLSRKDLIAEERAAGRL